MTILISRRLFIGSIAAPAIVHATSLMPISAPWELVQEVRVGRVFTPQIVRYWSRKGVFRSETETLWYGRREWGRSSPSRPAMPKEEDTHG